MSHCPLSALIEHVIQSDRELQDRGRVAQPFSGSDVVSALWPQLLGVVPARLRQLRVVVQELEQDAVQAVTPRPEHQHAAMSDQNCAFRQKAD